MDFRDQRRQVKCMRIVQSPAAEHQSPVVDLVYWDGNNWKLDPDKRYRGIGGGSWNRRPAPANSMFRVRWQSRRPDGENCDGFRPRNYLRSWGVSELEFYSDDKCSSKIPLINNGVEFGDVNQIIGNRARNQPASVVTGGFRSLQAQDSLTYDYYPTNVADGSISTLFAADCGYATK